jgi:hypothetical protein
MYVVFLEEKEERSGAPLHTARTLEQAFAQIACRCGYSYRFEAEEHGWQLVLTDVEHPGESPDPIHSTCIKPRDAHYDLMTKAVDGRLKGLLAVPARDFENARIMRTNNRVTLQVEAAV